MSTQIANNFSPSNAVTLLIMEKEKLSDKVDEAVQVFRQNQAEQTKVIEAQGEAIGNLKAEVVQLNGQMANAATAHETAMKTLQDQFKQKLSALNEHFKKLEQHQNRLHVLHRNLPLCVELASLRSKFEGYPVGSRRRWGVEVQYVPQVTFLVSQIAPEFAPLARGDVASLFRCYIAAEEESIRQERETIKKLCA